MIRGRQLLPLLLLPSPYNIRRKRRRRRVGGIIPHNKGRDLMMMGWEGSRIHGPILSAGEDGRQLMMVRRQRSPILRF